MLTWPTLLSSLAVAALGKQQTSSVELTYATFLLKLGSITLKTWLLTRLVKLSSVIANLGCTLVNTTITINRLIKLLLNVITWGIIKKLLWNVSKLIVCNETQVRMSLSRYTSKGTSAAYVNATLAFTLELCRRVVTAIPITPKTWFTTWPRELSTVHWACTSANIIITTKAISHLARPLVIMKLSIKCRDLRRNYAGNFN